MTFHPDPEGKMGFLKMNKGKLFIGLDKGRRGKPTNNAVITLTSRRRNALKWRIIQRNNQMTIQSGEFFWHPMNGSDQPQNNNKIVTYTSWRRGTQWQLID